MSYEAAPATSLLASHCAACARPLLDAASVHASMGPECRQKYGVTSLDEHTRAKANLVIHAIAIAQRGPEVAQHLGSLRALGLDALADRIVKRLASEYAVIIGAEGARLTVKAAYDTAQAAGLGQIKGRRWDKERKLNTYPVAARAALYEALRTACRGLRCLGPKGEFTL